MISEIFSHQNPIFFHPAVSLGTATDLTKANVVLNTVVTMFAEPPG
jgi:hypothetical protein